MVKLFHSYVALALKYKKTPFGLIFSKICLAPIQVFDMNNKEVAAVDKLQVLKRFYA